MKWLAAAALVVACSSKPAPPPTEVALDQSALRSCRAGRDSSDGRVFVEAETAHGMLRFHAQQLWWNGEARECAKLDRVWDGGTRADGSGYWIGRLDVRCEGAPRIVGALELDCGNATAAEREALAKNKRDQQQNKR